MAFYGFTARVRRGTICPNVMGHVVRYPCRFYRWRAQGIWQEILNRLQQTADAANQIDWEVNFKGSTIVRAHQHAAGAKRGN